MGRVQPDSLEQNASVFTRKTYIWWFLLTLTTIYSNNAGIPINVELLDSVDSLSIKDSNLCACFNPQHLAHIFFVDATDLKQFNIRHTLEILKCISENAGLTHLRDAELPPPMLNNLSNMALRLPIVTETVV